MAHGSIFDVDKLNVDYANASFSKVANLSVTVVNTGLLPVEFLFEQHALAAIHPVPEPATALLIAFGAAVLARRTGSR
jgi:hypothetical protein